MTTQKQIEANKKNAKKAGRKKGYRTETTKLKEEALATFRRKASRMANTFLMAQTQEALGTYQIVRKDEIYNKKSKTVSTKWEVVDDKDEIEMVMNEFGEVDGHGEIDGKYYLIARDKPNHKASEAILNRTFGRAKESHEVSGKDGEPLIIKLDS